MPVSEEVNKSRPFSGEEFLSQRKEEDSLQLKMKFTRDLRQNVHLDVLTMDEGLIPSEAVSDIEFLSETNKQYAEIGLTERPLRIKKFATDLNNNTNQSVSTYMDVNCQADCSKSGPDEGLQTIYYTATGETTVKLGSYEYPIDPSPFFAESDDADSKLTQAMGITTRTLVDFPATISNLEEIMFCDGRDRGEAFYNHEHWNYDEHILENMDFASTKHTMKIPEFNRGTNEFDQVIKMTSSTSQSSSMKSDLNAHANALTLMSSYDCTKTLPTFSTFNKSIELDPFRSDVKFNSCFGERRWNSCEQSETFQTSMADYTSGNLNGADLFLSPEQWLNNSSYDSSPQHQTSSVNMFSKPFKDKMTRDDVPSSSSDMTNVFAPVSHNNKKCNQPDEMSCSRNSKNTHYSTSCSMDLSSQFTDSSQYRTASGICTDMERSAQLSADLQLNERLFEVTESRPKKKWKRGCRLWEYIRNLLLDPSTNPVLIKWVDRSEGTFKLVQNKAIAHMWGMKKGNEDMSYEKLSRAMRYYYKKQIFQPVIGKRLVYRFGPHATGWKKNT